MPKHSCVRIFSNPFGAANFTIFLLCLCFKKNCVKRKLTDFQTLHCTLYNFNEKFNLLISDKESLAPKRLQNLYITVKQEKVLRYSNYKMIILSFNSFLWSPLILGLLCKFISK